MNALIKKYGLSAMMMTTVWAVQAQELNSAYFTEGMTARHELNPAFANEQNYVSIPALGSVNVKMQGNFGLQDLLFKNPQTGYYNRTFMHPDISVNEALSGFNTGMNKVTADIGITLFSAGFNSFGGYNTIELKEKASVGVQLPYELFKFAKDLNNLSYQFEDIRAKGISYVELDWGHSRQITDKLRLGAKLKVLLGVANANISIDKMNANLTGNQWEITTPGTAEANVNMKGIKFVNTTTDYNFRSGSFEHVDLGETDIDGAGIGGFGLGLDLGGEYQIMKGLKVSAAIKDLGFISWNNNYILKQRTTKFTFDGFHDLAIKNEYTKEGEILDDQYYDYSDQLSDFFSLQNEGDAGGKTTALAATVNIGGEYTLPMYEPLTIGLLAQQRINGCFSWTEGRLSANWSPHYWLNGGMNLAVSTFAVSAGWIVNIHPKGFNFFIGMDHILGKMSKEFIPLSSNACFSLGLAVTWGGEKKRRSKLNSN